MSQSVNVFICQEVSNPHEHLTKVIQGNLEYIKYPSQPTFVTSYNNNLRSPQNINHYV